jgi:predicted TIM-barrel fold metal-dependent hydrolase
MRIISLEDHFWTPAIAEAIGALRNPDTDAGGPLAVNLADLGERRLAAMDAAGIDLQVISHTTPGVQHLDADTAMPLAREANDALARAVADHRVLPRCRRQRRRPRPTSSSVPSPSSASWGR